MKIWQCYRHLTPYSVHNVTKDELLAVKLGYLIKKSILRLYSFSSPCIYINTIIWKSNQEITWSNDRNVGVLLAFTLEKTAT